MRNTERNYFIYGHDGAGNHGCEALVRTTVDALDVSPEQITLVSLRPQEDLQYGLSRLAKVTEPGKKAAVSRGKFAFWRAYASLKLRHDYLPMDYLSEGAALCLKKGDVAVSIGGDSYCYRQGCINRLKWDKMYRYNGVKTVLWGVSIEPELLEIPEIAEDIRGFDLITARESISCEALQKINSRTILSADSAFTLPAGEVRLPDSFQGCDLVGINTSPMIEENETIPGITRENYIHLIRWILQETQMKILLIPHVEWKDADGKTDRIILAEIMKQFSESERLFLAEDCDCRTAKAYISKCRFFIGARTHSAIAAYSQCIPTLVLGYSVKSRGIARDLFGTEEGYVLPVQQLSEKEDLKNVFCGIIEKEEKIKSSLTDRMPIYLNRYAAGAAALKQL